MSFYDKVSHKRPPKKPAYEKHMLLCPMCRLPVYYTANEEDVEFTTYCPHCGVKIKVKVAEERDEVNKKDESS